MEHGASDAAGPARVTTLYDAFGKPSSLKRGWGFGALVEYGGRRVLFDTGGDLDDFAYNVEQLGVDLGRLDCVVLSHRHGDHTSGLHHVLRVNPSVTIYTPLEAGFFHSPVSASLLRLIQRQVDGLPDDLRYYGGQPPEAVISGSPWPGARFVQITEPSEVLPGFVLFSTQSEVPGTREMRELSLAIRTPRGLVLLVGCSHPGIEKILQTAVTLDATIHTLLGGFHLVDLIDPDVTRLAAAFRDRWKIERLAPAHCSGQVAFLECLRAYGERFAHTGVGSVVELPSSAS